MKMLGPYELNTVVCGEASQLLGALPADCIDLTVTSPPYDLCDYDEDGNLITHSKKGLRDYQGYDWDFALIAAELFRVTKPGGVVVWVVGDATVNGSETGTSFRQALRFMELGFNLHDTMIYYRMSPPSVDIMHNRYYQHFEYMFVLGKGRVGTCNHIRVKKLYIDNRVSKGGHRLADGKFTKFAPSQKTDKVKGNVWRYSAGGGQATKDEIAHQHPAIFPEALARDHIRSWSNLGDLVLDPMCGSGTTCKAAKQLGRQWLGFDIAEEYVKLARLRVEQANPPLFVI